MNKIRIRNELLWEYQWAGKNIDVWLLENVGYGGWTEHIGTAMLPYRSFSFKNPIHETEFILKWL